MATEYPHILGLGRTEIDTSALFESVKEAANPFGGMGFWKPDSQRISEHHSEYEGEVVDVAELEEKTAALERDLIAKEKETLDVFKELEWTKNILEELKSKMQKEVSEINEEGSCEKDEKNSVGCEYLCPSEAPGLILLELKRAKLNLTKTTTHLACIRATIDAYKERIEKERACLEETRRRLSSNASRMLIQEEKVEKVNDNEAAKSQVQVTLSEIEETKGRIKAAKIRLIAARKMKEAARASEAAAYAEMRALSGTNKSEDVTLTFNEYASLISKAREAEQSCRARVADALLKVDEARMSRAEILKKIEEAAEEVKISKKALEEALSRGETVNRRKLAVEEAVRVWRSKPRSVHRCTKLKKPSVQHNGGMRQTLSIGEILSRKLVLSKEYGNGMRADKITKKRKVSLGQILGKVSSDPLFAGKPEKENKEVPAERKRFGFARINLLVSKRSKKKKNI